MRAIASFLLFMVVHRLAVCNELHPISAFGHIARNRLDWFSDDSDYIEPLKENLLFDEEFLAKRSDPLNQEDLVWMKTNIVDRYKFEKDPTRDIWTKLPNFKEDLGTSEFTSTADRVKTFFERNNDWETSKQSPEFRTKDSCTNLLYITAARYLLVTHILYVQSGKKLIPCVREDDQIVIPETGVCFPEPYGSASCTSDYDVGLVGKDSGYLTEKFNSYFQEAFGRPSALVFDTNIYAFSLEYSMPPLFAKLPANFAQGVAELEHTVFYTMQELASAYYKVFKYNEVFFHEMVDGAKSALIKKAKRKLNTWLKTFNRLNSKWPMKPGGSLSSEDAFRTAHNNQYAKYVKNISAGGGYNPKFLGILPKAEIYAAQAYHTRGAIRHVVGGMQMDTAGSLSTTDLWVSMIENWGDANKEFNHCHHGPLEKCFLKMSKYMWRTFNAMRLVRERLPSDARDGLVHFEDPGFANPEYATKIWMGYRKQGKTEIPTDQANVEQFLQQFNCTKPVFGKPFPPTCMSKMNDKVNAYNVELAARVTDE